MTVTDLLINDLLRAAQQAWACARGARDARDAVPVVAMCDDGGQPAEVAYAAREFCDNPSPENGDAFARVAVTTAAMMIEAA